MLDWFRTDPDTLEDAERPSAETPTAAPDVASLGRDAEEPAAATNGEDRARERSPVPGARMVRPAPQPGTSEPGPSEPGTRRPPSVTPDDPRTRADAARVPLEGPEVTEPDGRIPEVEGSPHVRTPEAERPPPPVSSQAATATRARIVCIANQKGGVGKTTTAVSLAAALADAGAQVLLVDLDPQGNATTGLGLRPQEGAPSTYRVLIEEMPVEDATEPTSVRGLHCLPSSLDLAGAEIELVSVFNRERRLSQGLEEVRDLYDVILIDCPPTLGLLTVNALAAADSVILPIQCEYYALEGVGQLTRTVDLVRRGLNPTLVVGGVVLTMYDGRTKLSEQVADEVRSHFPSEVFRTIIPRTVRLSEAPSYGQPITVYDPGSRGARAYLRLADEVARRLDLQLQTLSPLDDLLGTGAEMGEDEATGAEEPDEDAARAAEPDDEEPWA